MCYISTPPEVVAWRVKAVIYIPRTFPQEAYAPRFDASLLSDDHKNMNYWKALHQHNFTRLRDTSGFPLSPLKKSSDTEIYKRKYVNKPIEHYKYPIKRSNKKLLITPSFLVRNLKKYS